MAPNASGQSDKSNFNACISYSFSASGVKKGGKETQYDPNCTDSEIMLSGFMRMTNAQGSQPSTHKTNQILWDILALLFYCFVLRCIYVQKRYV